MIDAISDMLTRIRNAQAAYKAEVLIPASRFKIAIAEVLKGEGFIEDFRIDDVAEKAWEKNIVVTLKYEQISHMKKAPTINGIKQVSKQGQRQYVKREEIAHVKGQYGISVISTSQGVMTGKEARKRGLGGEVICEVW